MNLFEWIDAELIGLFLLGLFFGSLLYGFLNALHPADRNSILKTAVASAVAIGAGLLIVWQSDFVASGTVGYVDDLAYLAILIGAVRFGIKTEPEEVFARNCSKGCVE